MNLSSEHAAMLQTWAKTFVTALLASFLALGTPPWELRGEEWLSILWSGLLALAMVVYNYLDPRDTRYGKRKAAAPVAAPAPAPKPVAVPQLKAAPAPTAKKAPAAKPAAAKKAPAKKATKKK